VQVEADHTQGRFGRFALRPVLVRRVCGAAVTFLVGPAAMALAFFRLGMGPMEASAVLILLSGWLGPRLMRAEAR
jgi:hypothetical protein